MIEQIKPIKENSENLTSVKENIFAIHFIPIEQLEPNHHSYKTVEQKANAFNEGLR